MFCDEHGTVDYCPECVEEFKQKRIKELELVIKDIQEKVSKVIDAETSMYALTFIIIKRKCEKVLTDLKGG